MCSSTLQEAMTEVERCTDKEMIMSSEIVQGLQQEKTNSWKDLSKIISYSFGLITAEFSMR